MISALVAVLLLVLPILSIAENSRLANDASSKKQSFWVRQRDWILIGIILVGWGAVAFWPQHRSEFKPLVPGSSGAKYQDEFRHFKWSEAASPEAPNGSAKVEEENGPKWMPLNIFQTCHTFWIVRPDGERSIVAKADEMDAGSGRSFSWAWSKDSKAIFFSGGYRHLDCDGPPGEFRMIYTVNDETRWTVPD